MAGKGGSSRKFTRLPDLMPALWWSIGAIVLGALLAEVPIKLVEIGIAGVKPVVDTKPDAIDWSAMGYWVCIVPVALGGFVLCFDQATQAMKSKVRGIDVQKITQREEARQGKGVILALSYSSGTLTTADLPGTSGKEKIKKFVEKNPDNRHPWQQTIRAIDHHVRWSESRIEKFPQISILTSIGTEGSHKSIENFKKLMSDLYGDVLNRSSQEVDDFLRLPDHGIDFEDVGTVFDSILDEIEHMRRTHKFTEKQIVVDATGGQKPCSIAVGYVTLRSPDLLFQYVTNDGEVKNYNVDATSIEFAKLGG
ncbi:MAG: hypothetical protein R3C70_11010 [Geminicoccaceae bacterium]